MRLTGDELKVNQNNYLIINKNGDDIFLGKLLEREKVYCCLYGIESKFNNNFVFEKMYDLNNVLPIDTWHNSYIFKKCISKYIEID